MGVWATFLADFVMRFGLRGNNAVGELLFPKKKVNFLVKVSKMAAFFLFFQCVKTLLLTDCAMPLFSDFKRKGGLAL